MKNAKVLIVDDETNMRFFLSEALSKQGYSCAEAGDGHIALERMEDYRPDIIILDLKMPRMSGIKVLPKIRALDPDAAVIIVTAVGSLNTAYQALEEGAYDFFSKPLDIHELRTVVGRAAERVRLVRAVKSHQKRFEEAYALESILGQSQAVLQLRELLQRVGPTESTALITGESGTGKELAARVIHYRSSRREGPFVAMNCAAITETLLEAELFGHEKGAFTGAHQQRIGKFESADGGTVFLDEIGDMPLTMQAKILRVLQERVFTRIGGVSPVQVDIRLIAATNRDLYNAVKQGSFREDLFYRLNVVPVHIVPLRERTADIPVLAQFFLKKCSATDGLVRKRLSPGALKVLSGYPWPGNVRELDNIIQRAVILSTGEEITEKEMRNVFGYGAPLLSQQIIAPDLFTNPVKQDAFFLQDTIERITEQVEKQIIQKALEAQYGKRQETADLLKISRKSLHNKMKKYGME